MGTPRHKAAWVQTLRSWQGEAGAHLVDVHGQLGLHDVKVARQRQVPSHSLVLLRISFRVSRSAASAITTRAPPRRPPPPPPLSRAPPSSSSSSSRLSTYPCTTMPRYTRGLPLTCKNPPSYLAYSQSPERGASEKSPCLAGERRKKKGERRKEKEERRKEKGGVPGGRGCRPAASSPGHPPQRMSP